MKRISFTGLIGALVTVSCVSISVAQSVQASEPSNPRLDVTVESLAASNTAVKNQKDINLFRFQAHADESHAIRLFSTTFINQAGALLNATNYTLWVDTDGNGVIDTTVQGGVNPAGGRVKFDALANGGYVIPAGQSVFFEVHADVVPSPVNNMLQIKFDTTSNTYIKAERESNGQDLVGISYNGACNSTCQIYLTARDSTFWTIAIQGILYVYKDTAPLLSHQLLGGIVSDPVLRVEFHAEKEDVDVRMLQISTWDSLDNSIDRLDLYKAGETNAFAVATVGTCGNANILRVNYNNNVNISTFCAIMTNRQLTVSKTENTDVIIKARMKNDENGAVSGQNIRIWIPKNGNTVQARGVISSNNLSNNNGNSTAEGEIFIGLTTPAPSNVDIVGNPNQVVLSKITSITNANPDANGTAVPTGISPIGQFRFTGASHFNFKNGMNKSVLSDAIFDVNAQNVAVDLSSFKLYNKSDASNKANCSVIGGNGSVLTVECANLTAGTVDTGIYPGGNTDIVLEASVINTTVNPALSSSLQVSIGNFTDINASAFGAAASHLKWMDTDTSSTSFYWVESGDTAIYSTQYQN